MQQGLEEPHSAQKARQAGLRVVMNRCMKIEHGQRHL
jgi:predicted CoA-binding protein